MLGTHPRSASGRGECSLLAFLGGPPFPAVARVSASGICTDDDRRRVVPPGAERSVVRVIGDDNAVGAQLVDQHGRTSGAGHLGNGAAPRSGFPGRAGEQDGKGGQVREDLVFADVGVRGPSRFLACGAGVAVAAPVGGLAVGPR